MINFFLSKYIEKKTIIPNDLKKDLKIVLYILVFIRYNYMCGCNMGG